MKARQVGIHFRRALFPSRWSSSQTGLTLAQLSYSETHGCPDPITPVTLAPDRRPKNFGRHSDFSKIVQLEWFHSPADYEDLFLFLPLELGRATERARPVGTLPAGQNAANE